MPLINIVLKKMTLDKYVSAAERNLREASANARLIELEARQAMQAQAAQVENVNRCLELDRPEYMFAKNAVRKAGKYQRHIANRKAGI